MITITGDFYLVIFSKRDVEIWTHIKKLITLTSDYIKQLSLLKMITLFLSEAFWKFWPSTIHILRIINQHSSHWDAAIKILCWNSFYESYNAPNIYQLCRIIEWNIQTLSWGFHFVNVVWCLKCFSSCVCANVDEIVINSMRTYNEPTNGQNIRKKDLNAGA